MRPQTSPKVEDYLEAIHRCARASGFASTNDVARRLGVSVPAVTRMLSRLTERDLVTHRPYRGVRLTDSGRKLARRLIRRHRLAERLLTDVIGLPWEMAHDEACKLQHAIAGEVETRLAELLADKTTCPHGHPLDPTTRDDSLPLVRFQPPQKLQVVKLADESPEVILYLEKAGLVPGAWLRLTQREPFGGPLTVETAKGRRSIGRELADNIWVKPAASER
jgi:DtxR family Mn-dependent transcriptional regulator